MNNNIIYLKKTSSTNSYLKELEKGGLLPDKTVVWTDFQTAGRGQRNNSWESESGKNLLFSMIIYPSFIAANEQFILAQIASVAIKQVLDRYVENVSIKWPNDIYWNDRKICGMLIENELIEGHINTSIVGAGININQDTFYGNAPNPVSLKQITSTEANREEILMEIVDTIGLLYEQSKIDRLSVILLYKDGLYRKNGYHLYADVLGNRFSAVLEDVEDSGLLVLKTQGEEIRKFAFKEVRYL